MGGALLMEATHTVAAAAVTITEAADTIMEAVAITTAAVVITTAAGVGGDGVPARMSGRTRLTGTTRLITHTIHTTRTPHIMGLRHRITGTIHGTLITLTLITSILIIDIGRFGDLYHDKIFSEGNEWISEK